jgi:hypothetical protein
MATADDGGRPRVRPVTSWLIAALSLALMLFALRAWAGEPGKLPPPPPPPAPVTLPLDAAPRIGVITMAPGDVFFERFGHDAIVVAPADGSEPVSYNFGFFDLSEEDFLPNFIRGRMRYMLVALPLDVDLAGYRESGRGVQMQWLDLTPDQARALAAALADNALPENARYTYDYYTANCSTRVRDALDQALGGRLRAQLTGRSQGNTYRTESVRLAWPAKWMAAGFEVGLGGYADRPLSRWDEAFIPMRLRDSLREVKLADGRPLVVEETTLLPHRLDLPPAEMPDVRLRALVAGAVLALGLLWLAKRRRRVVGAIALVFWTLCGLVGALMLFIWLGTAHVAGYANQYLLLLSPLAFALLPGGWALARGRAPSRRFDAWLWVLAGSAAIAGFLTFLPFLAQRNLDLVLLLLPVHLALAYGLSRPALVAGAPAGRSSAA